MWIFATRIRFASLGFAILFNIRKEKMIYAAFIGMIGGVLYYMVMNYGYSEVFALFFWALLNTFRSHCFHL